MSRMNNTANSLKIISRQNGWEPDQITDFSRKEGLGHPEPETDYNFSEVNDVRDPQGRGTPWSGIPGCVDDPQGNAPDTTASTKPSFHTGRVVQDGDSVYDQPFSKYKPGAGEQ